MQPSSDLRESGAKAHWAKPVHRRRYGVPAQPSWNSYSLGDCDDLPVAETGGPPMVSTSSRVPGSLSSLYALGAALVQLVPFREKATTDDATISRARPG